MKGICRRVRRLEDRLTVRVDVVRAEFICDRLDRGRQRLDQARLRGEYEEPTYVRSEHTNTRGFGLVEILHAGRDRARLQTIQEEELKARS